MSDGLKTGLILGGAGLVAFLLYERSQAAAVAAGVPTVAGSSPLATSPGAAPSASAAPKSSSGSSAASSIVRYAAVATVAPFYYPVKIGLSAAKPVVGAVESGVKTVGSAVGSVFKSIF